MWIIEFNEASRWV